MKKFSFVVAVALCVFSLNSMAHDEHAGMPAPKPMPKEFDTLKKLVGHWESAPTKEGTVAIDYKLTAGGTVLEERMMPGTDHEMVSMYYADGKTLAMTHYCALGNQPKMKLKDMSDNTMKFEMAGKEGVASKNDMHMHSLLLTWNSPTEITERWTSFNKGKSADEKVFTLVKK